MKKLLLLAITAILGISAYAQNAPITEQPKGTLTTYARSGKAFVVNSKTNEIQDVPQEGQALNIVTEADGKTVWLQDPVALTGAGTWVKGEKTNNTITVKSGQLVLVINGKEGPISIYAGMLQNDNGNYTLGGDITYTIAGDNITLNGTNEDLSSILGLYIENKGNAIFIGYGEVGSTYAKFTKKPVAIPEDIKLDEYTLTAANAKKEFNDKMAIGKKGNDIYFKGLLAGFNDGAIKGTFDEKTNIATFDAKQFMGIHEGYFIYLLGSNDGNTETDKIQFQYDPAAKEYKAITKFLVFNCGETAFNGFTYYTTCTLKNDPAGIETATAETAKQIASEKYFDLSGREISKPENGVSIKKVTFTDGSTKAVKFIGK